MVRMVHNGLHRIMLVTISPAGDSCPIPEPQADIPGAFCPYAHGACLPVPLWYPAGCQK